MLFVLFVIERLADHRALTSQLLSSSSLATEIRDIYMGLKEHSTVNIQMNGFVIFSIGKDLSDEDGSRLFVAYMMKRNILDGRSDPTKHCFCWMDFNLGTLCFLLTVHQH